jgi:16S rRNA processing protein RimM
MPNDRWVPLAEISKPHGIRGEVRLKVYNPESDVLWRQRELMVCDPSGTRTAMHVEAIRGGREAPILKLSGVETREHAERLRGHSVIVPRSSLPTLAEGEFYVDDLIGARVLGPAGEIGKVETMISYPSTDALVVRLGDDVRTVEIPLVDAFVESVQLERHEVVLSAAALEFLP